MIYLARVSLFGALPSWAQEEVNPLAKKNLVLGIWIEEEKPYRELRQSG